MSELFKLIPKGISTTWSKVITFIVWPIYYVLIVPGMATASS